MIVLLDILKCGYRCKIFWLPLPVLNGDIFLENIILACDLRLGILLPMYTGQTVACFCKFILPKPPVDLKAIWIQIDMKGCFECGGIFIISSDV
jgi:hypothetical protein